MNARRCLLHGLGAHASAAARCGPEARRIAPLTHFVHAARTGLLGRKTYENSHDWQSYVRLRSFDRFCNHLFRSARKCGAVRRKLAHGRRDHQRPLRKNQHWPWNKPRPNSFYWWLFRSPPDSGGWPRFRLGANPDKCSGWPAQRPWDRTVRSVSGQRDVGRSRALRCLLGRVDRHSGQVRSFVRT